MSLTVALPPLSQPTLPWQSCWEGESSHHVYLGPAPNDEDDDDFDDEFDEDFEESLDSDFERELREKFGDDVGENDDFGTDDDVDIDDDAEADDSEVEVADDE